MGHAITGSNGGRAASLRAYRGLTLVELAVALGIAAVLVAIVMPSYQQYRERVRVTQAKNDIATMSAVIANYFNDARDYPNSLADVGLGGMRDPWGNPYGYLNLNNPRARGAARKNRALVPINSDFDLYSKGPDGRSAPPLTSQLSRDDIVRANNGAFIGLASEY